MNKYAVVSLQAFKLAKETKTTYEECLASFDLAERILEAIYRIEEKKK
jgi:hypothetical protein